MTSVNIIRDHEFQDFMDVLRTCRQDDDRLRRLRVMCSSDQSFFTCAQASEIVGNSMQMWALSEPRMQASRMLYPRISDKDNFFNEVIMKNFEFEEDRDELKEQLGL